jgi:hypothetical protein
MSGEVGEKKIHKRLFIAKTGKQRQIHVFGKSGLAPSLDRKSADETKIPTLRFKKDLQFRCFFDEIFH